MRIRTLIPVAVLTILLAPLFAQPDFAQGDFFIVSSIDLTKRQILLKRPTEVTELMRVDGETRYFEERGKPIRLTDLRAGDTVFIVSKPGAAQPVAVTIHKGPMTPDVLRDRYGKGKK